MRCRSAADRGERGSITAEFAVVLPAALLVIAIGIGGMQVAGEQVRLQSAAADAARLFGRGDAAEVPAVIATVPGAALSHSNRGDLVCVTLRAPVELAGIRAVTLVASACALDDAA